MLSLFLISVLPFTCFVLFSLILVAELFWRMFARRSGVVDPAKSGEPILVLRAVSALLLLEIITFWMSSCTAGYNGFCLTQVLVAILALSSISYLASHYFQHPDIVVFLVFTSLATPLLLLASDLITVFFVLELLNGIILYSFFFTASYSGVTRQNMAARIVSSCVYQFTLNFFSSILLYSGVCFFISLTGGSSLNGAVLLSLESNATLSMSFIAFAFLLKFGTGPWIFFKINIYRSMNYQLIILYSALYFLVVFMFFLNLFFVFGLSLNAIFYPSMIFLVSISATTFASFAFQNPNIFVFISFSSLINLSIFVLQVLSVV